MSLTFGPRAFTIGGALRRTFALLGRDLPAFVGLALVLGLLPRVAGVALSYALAAFDPITVASAPAGAVAVCSVVHRGAALALALRDEGAARPSLAAALRTGSALLFPNAVILILVWLGVGLAAVLLLVPGVMLLCRWSVALPAEVAERRGVRGALARSRDLTAGHRWRIFGLLAVYAVPAAVAPWMTLFQDPDASADAKAIVGVMAAVVGTAVAMVGNVGLAAIYAELRAARDGAAPAEIAAAFG